jgi:hypothetical protein
MSDQDAALVAPPDDDWLAVVLPHGAVTDRDLARLDVDRQFEELLRDVQAAGSCVASPRSVTPVTSAGNLVAETVARALIEAGGRGTKNR